MRREVAILALQGMVEEGKAFTLEIKGTSMLPFLRAGDRVQVQAVPPSKLALGDLIAFLQDGNLIVHRFAGRCGARGLREKGDNVRGFRLVPPESLVGRVVQVETGTRTRFLLHGPGLWGNRLRGLRAWGVCTAWDWLRQVRARLPRGRA